MSSAADGSSVRANEALGHALATNAVGEEVSRDCNHDHQPQSNHHGTGDHATAPRIIVEASMESLIAPADACATALSVAAATSSPNAPHVPGTGGLSAGSRA